MLTIRNAQLKTLQNVKWRTFRQEAHRYLAKAVPHLHVSYRRSEIKQIIQRGVEKTKQYQNVNSEKDIFKFIELMVRYGVDFDSDESLPFVNRIVQERMVYEREPYIDALYGLKDKATVAQRAAESDGYDGHHF